MKYNGFEIELSDDGKIVCDELGIEEQTVAEAKSKINAHNKNEKDAPKRKRIIWTSYLHDEYCYCEVGAIFMRGFDECATVTWIDGKGDKNCKQRSIKNIYADTPENKTIFEKVVGLNNKAHKLQDQASQLESRLKSIASESE